MTNDGLVCVDVYRLLYADLNDVVGVDDGDPCGGDPCGGDPCGGDPCGVYPCGVYPCGVYPCGVDPCGVDAYCALWFFHFGGNDHDLFVHDADGDDHRHDAWKNDCVACAFYLGERVKSCDFVYVVLPLLIIELLTNRGQLY